MTVTQTRNEIGDALKELWVVMDVPFDDFLQNLKEIFKDVWTYTREETKLHRIKCAIKDIKTYGTDFYMNDIKSGNKQEGKDKKEIEVFHHHSKSVILTQDEQECFKKAMKYLETLSMPFTDGEDLHIISNTTAEDITKEFKNFIDKNRPSAL